MDMSASELTRQAIIRSTKELASGKPFQKLSVMEISRACGINRNTFYYYFGDKYDVLRWIFDHEVLPVLESRRCTRSLAESVSALCSYLKNEKAFYTRTLEDSSHRGLRELLVQYYKGFLMEVAASHFEEHRIEDVHREIAARFYAHGTVGMICDWAARDMKMDSSFATSIIQLSAREKFFV